MRDRSARFRLRLQLVGQFVELGDGRFQRVEEKYTSMLALAEGSMPEAEFAERLRRHIQLQPGSGAHEPAPRYAGKTGR